MRLERYTVKANEDLMAFEFISEGPKGRIIKWIRFVRSGEANVYNLAFGDKKEHEDDFDDEIVTDNKDSQKVLATVATSVLVFTQKYPEAWVFATGSTKSRTRLYRMGISQNFDELQKYFNILGSFENKWVKFEMNKDYDAFIVKRK
jgi:hypothetical protein